MLDPAQALAMALDPALIHRAQGIEHDPWQRNLLLSAQRQVLLLGSRGAGKSRAVSALVLPTALFHPRSLVLLSRARPVGLVTETETQWEFADGRPHQSSLISTPYTFDSSKLSKVIRTAVTSGTDSTMPTTPHSRPNATTANSSSRGLTFSCFPVNMISM